MAEFSSEWRGLGKEGKDLASDEDIMEMGRRSARGKGKGGKGAGEGGGKERPISDAKVFRLFMMQTKVDAPVWLKEAQGVVMQELGNLTAGSARQYRIRMQRDYGLIKTFKEEDGRRWLIELTDRGVDFVNWLIQDPDGQRWGLKSEVDLSAEEKRRFNEAFIMGNRLAGEEALEEGGAGGGMVELKDGVVKWKLGRWGLVLDERIPRSVWARIMSSVHREGMRTVFVPDGYEVVVVEMTDKGKKAHRVTRWSEFPIVDRQLIIDTVEVSDESDDDDDLGEYTE